MCACMCVCTYMCTYVCVCSERPLSCHGAPLLLSLLTLPGWEGGLEHPCPLPVRLHWLPLATCVLRRKAGAHCGPTEYPRTCPRVLQPFLWGPGCVCVCVHVREERVCTCLCPCVCVGDTERGPNPGWRGRPGSIVAGIWDEREAVLCLALAGCLCPDVPTWQGNNGALFSALCCAPLPAYGETQRAGTWLSRHLGAALGLPRATTVGHCVRRM